MSFNLIQIDRNRIRFKAGLTVGVVAWLCFMIQDLWGNTQTTNLIISLTTRIVPSVILMFICFLFFFKVIQRRPKIVEVLVAVAATIIIISVVLIRTLQQNLANGAQIPAGPTLTILAVNIFCLPRAHMALVTCLVAILTSVAMTMGFGGQYFATNPQVLFMDLAILATMIVVSIFALVQTIVIERQFRNSFVLSKKLELEKNLSDLESSRSRKVLSNILPQSFVDKLIDDLKSEEYSESTQLIEYHDDAVVLMSDICSFTDWSGGKSAEEVIFMLNKHFSFFDRFSVELGLEKVKTIGDAYFCIGLTSGLGLRNDVAERMVLMANKMIESVHQLNRKYGWELRIRVGIANGPVHMGVFGSRLLTFDCFGRGVNISHHLESTSHPGCVQVSETIFNATSHKFEFIHHNDHDIPNVGIVSGYLLRGEINKEPIIIDLELLKKPMSPSTPSRHDEVIHFEIEEPKHEPSMNVPVQKDGYHLNRFLLVFSSWRVNWEAMVTLYESNLPALRAVLALQVLVTALIVSFLIGQQPTLTQEPVIYIGIGALALQIAMAILGFTPLSRKYVGVGVTIAVLTIVINVGWTIAMACSQFIATALPVQMVFSMGITNMLPIIPFPFKVISSIFMPITPVIVTCVLFGTNVLMSFSLNTVSSLLLQSIASYLCTRTMLNAFVGNKRLEAKIEETTREQKRNDRLILSSMPRSVAERLRDGSDVHDTVQCGTACFISCEGFNELLEVDSSLALTLLNELFTEFDELAEACQCQKIKSIGNSYLVVTGLDGDTINHSQRMAKFALEARAIANRIFGEIHDLSTTHNKAVSNLGIRAGIFSGEFSAGVLGYKKLLYDVFGDTINSASRMSTTCNTGDIQLCGRVCDELRLDFDLVRRGIVDIKGKGRMETMLLVGEKATYVDFPIGYGSHSPSD